MTGLAQRLHVRPAMLISGSTRLVLSVASTIETLKSNPFMRHLQPRSADADYTHLTSYLQRRR